MNTIISTYDQQAIDFLKATNTQFSSEYIRFGKYFPDDKQQRNIFKCTLSNSNGVYSFEFGSSLSDSVSNLSQVMYADYIDFYCGLKFEGLEYEYLTISHKIKISAIKSIYDTNKWLSLIPKDKIENAFNIWLAANTIKGSKYRSSAKPKFQLKEWIDIVENRLMRRAVELKRSNWGVGIQAKEITHPTAYDVLACLTKCDPGTFENFCSEYGYDEDSRRAEKTYNAVKEEWQNVCALFTDSEIEQLQEIQ